MFQVADEETYQDGQLIYEEGNGGDWLYVIESGAVEIFKKKGKERVVIEVLQPGDVFGEVAFFAKIPRTASARAIGPTTIDIIDRDFLDQEYNRLSGSFQMILKSLALRLEKTTEKAAQPKLRREEPRLPKILSLSFKNSAGFVNAFSEDMGAGGMFIKTPKPLGKGEQFVLKLQVTNASETFKIGCEVSWNRTKTDNPDNQPLGMGIKFTKINPADHQRLRGELLRAKN